MNTNKYEIICMYILIIIFNIFTLLALNVYSEKNIPNFMTTVHDL